MSSDMKTDRPISMRVLIKIFAMSCVLTCVPAHLPQQTMQSRVLKKWEEIVLGRQNYSSNKRAPAATDSTLCLKDQDSASLLLEEIRQLESQSGGASVKGVWNHLNLSALPRAQGLFFSRNSKWIASKGYDFKNCTDVFCVMNSIYGNSNGTEGYKVYQWFLKMGYVLSTSERIPILPNGYISNPEDLDSVTISGKIFRDFLFSKDELTGFWLLSKTLSPIYQNMGSLQSIHRLPRQFSYESWPNTCGISWGGKTIGNIRLMDQCLIFGSDPKNLRSFFYRGVAHELSHRLDSWLGNGQNDLSNTDEWKSLSGWVREESIDPKSGKPVIQWKFDPDKDGFVRNYAAASPVEDWADTAAYFRYFPSIATEKSPKKSAFISQKIYGGRTYDQAGLLSYYLDVSRREFALSLVPLVEGCLGGSTQAQDLSWVNDSLQIAPWIQFQLEFSLEPQVLQCLKDRVAAVLKKIIVRLNQTEYEACDFFEANTPAFVKQLIEQITPQLVDVLSKRSTIADQLRGLAQLQDELKFNFDAREVYLKCFGKDREEECYLDSLAAVFDSIAQNSKSSLSPEILKEEKNRFLTENPWGVTRGITTKLFKDLFAGVEIRLQSAAASRWETCKNALELPSGSVPPTRPFSGGEHYVSGGILTCINEAVSSDLDSIREALSSRIGITVSDQQTQAFIRGLWLPSYIEVLNAYEQKEAQIEDRIREELRTSVVSSILKELIGEPSISLTTKEVCIESAQKSFDRYLSQRPGDQLIPTRFIALESLRRQWSGQACEEFFQSKNKTKIRSGRR